MPHRNITHNILDLLIIGSLALYVFLWALLPTEGLLRLINELLLGLSCAVAYIFRYTIFNILWNREQVHIIPERLLALSILGLWVGVNITGFGSVIGQSGGPDWLTTAQSITSLGRYIIVCSGVAQMFAQGLDIRKRPMRDGDSYKDYVHGEDTRAIYIGIGGGMVIAIGTMLFQNYEVLKTMTGWFQ